jgi:serine/threonine protein kinase
LFAGCPPGTYSIDNEESGGCISCPIGKYSIDNEDACISCPIGTQSVLPGATSKNLCGFCNVTNPNADCVVNVANNNFEPRWTCYGTFGSQCATPCPGGAESPCNGDGKCDDGPTGNGTCKCDFFHYGPACSKRCDCNPEGGTCNDGAEGDGTCTCYPLYTLSGPGCKTPVLGILLSVVAALVAALLVLSIYWLRKINLRTLKKEMHEMSEDFGIELSVMNEAYGIVVEDRSKLQNAWIVQFTEVQLDFIIGQGEKIRIKFFYVFHLKKKKKKTDILLCIFFVQGAFGDVFKGRWRGLQVAVKKVFPEEMMELGNTMSTSSSNGNQMNEVSRAMLENLEVGVMMRLRHPRIVTFLGAGEIIDPPLEGDDVPRVGIFVMLEYAAGGDLANRLAAAATSPTSFSWKDRIQCAMDIAEGMAFIHDEGFIHRDLKSLNVLCDETGRCMIADLGLACSNVRSDAEEQHNGESDVDEEDTLKTSWAGSAPWMAPEVMVVTERQNFKNYSSYGFKADVFSFGMVMFELLTCRIPWAGMNKTFSHQIMKAVTKDERPFVSTSELAKAPRDYVVLMHQCWDTDANVRPTFNELVVSLKNVFKGAPTPCRNRLLGTKRIQYRRAKSSTTRRSDEAKKSRGTPIQRRNTTELNESRVRSSM